MILFLFPCDDSLIIYLDQGQSAQGRCRNVRQSLVQQELVVSVFQKPAEKNLYISDLHAENGKLVANVKKKKKNKVGAVFISM